MTLIMGMSFKDEFVMVASDSMVVKVPYGPLPKDFSMNDAPIADFSSEKVTQLTDKVLVASSGSKLGEELLENELIKRVNWDNDLGECADIMRQILLDAEEGLLGEYKAAAVENVLKGDSNCALYGFYHNGQTGAACSEGENHERRYVDVESPMDGRYPALIVSPDSYEDRDDFFNYIKLPIEQQKVENFVELFTDLHAYFSFQHQAVSSDCNFHFLRNDGGTIKYYSKTVETADRYQELGLIK